MPADTTNTQPTCLVKDIQFFAKPAFLNHKPSLYKYRSRFEEEEVSYLYWDIELINLLYKKQNNSVVIKHRSKALTTGKEMFAGEQTVNFLSSEISKIATHSWGNSIPGFWKADQYLWEVLINGNVQLSKTLIIDKLGMVTETDNPYFELLETKLFLNGTDETVQAYRYLTQFNAAETESIGIELTLKRKFNYSKSLEYVVTIIQASSGLAYVSQRFEIFYSATPQPLAECTRFRFGCGKNVFWSKGPYLFYVSFMNVTIAAGQFTVGDMEIAGIVQPLTTTILNAAAITEENRQDSIKKILAQLDTMIGMYSVKKSIRENIDYLKFNKLRMEKGFADDGQLSLHSVFTGNPGTGKTTIVNMLGKIYKAMGLLSKGHVVEATRADIIGEYIGQTAPKTKALIEKARGGILFLDEVYALARQDSKNDFGAEAVEIIMKEMSDGPGNIAIIGAGYPDEVNAFINSNPGLKSRFSQRFHFDDYMPDELMQIAHVALQKEEATISPEAEKELSEILADLYRSRDRSFGNARTVFGIIDNAKKYMGIRLLQQDGVEMLSKEILSRIELQDLLKVFEDGNKKKLFLNIDDKKLGEALLELNNMVGLQLIKQEVDDKINLVKFYLESGKDVLNKFSLHAVLTGNPGTGKTTLARLLGKIYRALGLLERGHLVEVDRQNLVAGYVGQTALKTSQAIEQAMGGVLFIDEAYSLAGNNENDFGNEAIETLLKMMEDNRGRFAVIVAGYPDNMNEFICSNPGLQSRFDVAYSLPDYTCEELYTIAESQLALQELIMQPDAAQYLSGYLKKAFDNRDKFFGNARFVRQTVEAIVIKQNLRMAALPREQRTAETLKQILLSDVEQLQIKESSKRQTIGFKTH